MKRLFEDWGEFLDFFEIVGILFILGLLVAQTPVIGIPLSQWAGVGALYIALFGALRRRHLQNEREAHRAENREQERERQKGEGGMELHSEESDSPTVIYNVYGDNAYIDSNQEHREKTDRALDHNTFEERVAQNRKLDEFASERREPHGKEDEDEQTQQDTLGFVMNEDRDEEQEKEFELERE